MTSRDAHAILTTRIMHKTGQNLFTGYQLCPTLVPKEICFCVRAYAEGKFLTIYHGHVPKIRMSNDRMLEATSTLVARSRTAVITGTAIVQGVDKPNGKVKLTHDPIDALGWPKMTMFFRLKDSALADQVKEGDKVDFSLEKSASGYVITGFRKNAAGHDMKQMK